MPIRRLSRSQFLSWQLAVFGLVVLAYVVAPRLGLPMKTAAGTSSTAALALGALWSFVHLALAVARFHDRGRPGLHAGLLLVPFFNLVWTALLFVLPGQPGANPYGADPRARPTTWRTYVLPLGLFAASWATAALVTRTL